MQRLMEVLDKLGRPKVALVGDFMLDHYLYGDSERISPEAPVPILEVVNRESRPGGAASVAVNILALGGKVACVGIVGQDAAGEELLAILASAGAEISSLIRLPGRPTTVKERLIGLAQHRHRQQMLRVDQEARGAVPKEVLGTVRTLLRSAIRDCQCLALEDHDKGLFSDAATPQWIADARSAGVPVVVDPARVSDYRRYRGATMLTPNRFEAALASGIQITDEESLARCAQRLVTAADAEAVVITLDKEGAYLARRGERGTHIRTRQRTVYDVTGAGDAVFRRRPRQPG